MLNRITIRNFQSLSHVDLEIARFTVIVGQTSSGKSAFTRALKTLTSNRRGVEAFITHGERVMTIMAETERGKVTLKRGKGTNDNEYTVVPADPNEDQKTWTKLGGDVPEGVSEFLGIAAKDPLNYADQFDMPYLLKSSPPEAARILGNLTNVSVIFEAARESNRRKLSQAQTLKTRAADLAAIHEKVADYRPLKAQIAAIAEAETALREAQTLHERITLLRETIETIEVTSNALRGLQAILKLPTPDPSEITAAAERSTRFRQTLSEIKNYTSQIRRLEADLDNATATEAQLTEQYTEMLIEAGTCPVCKQDTHELEMAHV